jgi:ABC-type transport system substrate-binding protein
MASYWDKVLARRVSRRRALGISTTAAAAGFLTACNLVSDSGDNATPTPKSGTSQAGRDGASSQSGAQTGMLWQPVDTTGQAKRGGTWKAAGSTDPQSFDIYDFDPFSQTIANTVGTKLVYLKPARMRDPDEFNVTGDLAEDWEIAEDRLTYTFHLNPNKKFGPLSPSFHEGAPDTIANRVIDSADVLFSWERFLATSPNSTEFANELNSAAPIISLEAPDERTVVVKLGKPYSPLLVQLANPSVSYFYIIPKEGKDQNAEYFDKYLFGGGPFYIDEVKPSESVTLKRNPNFQDPDGLERPYADEVLYRIIPDLSEQIDKFRAGEIFQAPGTFTTDTNLEFKRDIPDLLMWALPDSSAVTEWFGMSADGPWKDERVRQAVQYSWDRDLFIDVAYETRKLEAAGIPVNQRWNTAIPCGGPGSYMFFPGMWLDPQSSEFGQNAKYFTLGSRNADISEAKRLLSAAGFPEGIDFKHAQYTLNYSQQPARDIIEAMMQEAGLRVTEREEIGSAQLFGYIFGGGQFSEMLNIVDFGGPDVGAFMQAHFHPAGNLFGGWSPGGTSASETGDPRLTQFVEDVLGEFDNAKRVQIVHEFQRYMARQFYYSRYPGGATTLRLAWPALSNWQTFRGYGLDGYYSYEWIDETQPPFV